MTSIVCNEVLRRDPGEGPTQVELHCTRVSREKVSTVYTGNTNMGEDDL